MPPKTRQVRTLVPTLATICEGAPDRQFQHFLRNALAHFKDENLQAGRDKMKAKVVITIDTEFDIESGELDFTSAVKQELPGFKKSSGRARLTGDASEFRIDVDDEQLDLINRGAE